MDITRTGRLLGPVVVAGLLLAGCGGGEPQGTTATPSADSGEPIKYSQCMRKNGVPKFPDPKNGRLLLKAGPGTGIDPESATFKAAAKACEDLAPAGPSKGEAPPKERQEEALAFAKCLRANGLPNFPDPDFKGGGISLRLPKGMTPDSPQVKKAHEICSDKMPGGPGSAP